MRIPAFGLGGTPTPYTLLDDPTRGQREATATAGRARVAEAATLADAGQTLGAVGKDVYAFTRRIEEQEALTALQSARSKYHVEGAQTAMEWESTIDGPSALDSLNVFKERLQPIKQRLIDAAPSELARERIRSDLDAREADFMLHGEKVVRKKFRDHSLAVAQESTQTFLKGAYLAGQAGDVAALQGHIDQGKAGFMALGHAGVVMSPSEAEMEAGKFEVTSVAAFLQGQLDNDRTAMRAVRDFEAGKYNDKLDFPTLQKMDHAVAVRKNQILAEVRREQAEARQRVREEAYDSLEHLSDQAASATATGKVSGDTAEALAKLRRLGGAFTRKADNLDSAITMGVSVHSVLQENVFLPFDQQRAKLEAVGPKEGEENYGIKAQAIQRGLRAIDAQEDAFRKDPAGFSIRRAANQVAQAGGDPVAEFARTLKSSLEIQRQMGLTETELRVVPAADAKRTAAQFETSDADGKLKIIGQLDAYGPYKGKALAEMKIDPAAQFASTVADSDDPRSTVAARTLLESVGTDKGKLPEYPDKQELKDTLAESRTLRVLEKQARLAGRGGAASGAFARELQSAAERMAALKGSARKALDVLELPYTAVEEDGVAVALVPKSLSASQAVHGFEALRGALDEKDLTETRDALVARHGAQKGERLFEETVRDLRRGGYWINDGDGYVLIDPRDNLPVRLNGGRKYRASAEDVKKARRPQAVMLDGTVLEEVP